MDEIQINCKNKSDGLVLLKNLPDKAFKVVFFDPQYRGLLDKLNYGNEGARQIGRCALPQMDNDTIVSFIKQIDRVLCPSGYLFLWLDKFHLVEGVQSWFTDTSLETVDFITWNKMKIGMGRRTRYSSEFLLVVQKAPKMAKKTWSIHNIPDVWSEKVIKTHPHTKPVELQKTLILATTNEGDCVCDPAAGGYSVLEACLQTNRNFIGCDILYG